MKLSSEINNCKSPRKWWKLVGTLLSSSQKHDIPPLTVDGIVYDNDNDKAFHSMNSSASKQKLTNHHLVYQTPMLQS